MNPHPDANNWNPNKYCEPYLHYRPRTPVSQTQLGPSITSRQQQIPPYGAGNIVNNQVVVPKISGSSFNMPSKNSFPDQKSWPRPAFVHETKQYMGESNTANLKNQEFIEPFNRPDYEMNTLQGNHTRGSMFHAQVDQISEVNNLQQSNLSLSEKQLHFSNLNQTRPFSPAITYKNQQYFHGRDNLHFVPNIQHCIDTEINKPKSNISQFPQSHVPEIKQTQLSQYSTNKPCSSQITKDRQQQCTFGRPSNFEDSTNKSFDYQRDELLQVEYQNQHYKDGGQPWKKIDSPYFTFEKVDNRDSSNLVTNESICNRETSRLKDTKWISQWINKKRLNSEKHNLSRCLANITVSQAKQLMCEALLLKDELNKMSGNVQPTDHQFHPKQEEIYRIKKRLMEIKSTLTNQPTLEVLQEKLKAVNKKRGRQKRKRKALFEENLKAEEERAAAHKRVDQCHENMLLRSIQAERDKEIKASADEILSEVRRKFAEAKKAIDLLGALRKLRKVKKEKALRKGVTIPQEIDSAFESRIDIALHLMRNQQKTYEDERKTLEVMLETEQEVNEEQEREKQKIKIEKKEKQLEKKIRKYLFGPEETVATDDPLLPYRQYYEIGNQSLEGLFKVRQEWDMYCVPDGTAESSRIGPTWVEPAESSSSVWASALEDNSI